MRSYLAASHCAVLSLAANRTDGQTVPSHPGDSTATLVAIDTVHWLLPSPGLQPVLTTSDDGATRHTVVVWRSTGGRMDYVVDAESLVAGDSADALDELSTAALFDRIAYASVLHGIAAGHADSTLDSLSTGLSRFYATACVERTGAGPATSFANCSTAWSRRNVAYGLIAPDQYEIEVLALPAETDCSLNSPGCESTTVEQSPSLLE